MGSTSEPPLWDRNGNLSDEFFELLNQQFEKEKETALFELRLAAAIQEAYKTIDTTFEKCDFSGS